MSSPSKRRRPIELYRVRDAGLCHGAFGIAHLRNRCDQASGDVEFHDAAQRWLAHGLAMRREGEGIAGFTAIVQQENISSRVGTCSLLEGASGIGLALVAALSSQEPKVEGGVLIAQRWVLARLRSREARAAKFVGGGQRMAPGLGIDSSCKHGARAAEGFARRFAGHVETSRDSLSDPALGGPARGDQ